ncbi:DJ-1/PfpI family protein [Peribacillus asahii]|uniref:DJ-1/PfpI family protein n=1 Tax=Peribacillus asahii TaxID=228899 RepID=UPI002079CD99|nr:DJ-1/PfpI family protein [Peribacillus asahii]USK61881.1 DJ-1/PfpI family protein [Peribacillus asahii]
MKNEELTSFLKQAYEQKVLVSGICVGSIAVAQTGLLAGRQANKAEYVVQNVVMHEDIITSNGPDGGKVSLTHYAKHKKDARN